MESSELANTLGPALARAFEERGYSALTPVQQAVLAPEHAGRDLRVSSQTGSGKTVALGLAVRDVVTEDATPDDNKARPRALVLVPTRELAKQVHEELSWLFAPQKLRVAAVTGGGGYRDELRSFRNGPAIIVGTPGRFRDHLDRGSIDPSNVAAVVLDEADRMLDFGFREEIEAIVGMLPEEKRVHLVSATFPRDVKALADRVQRDPAHVMGTPLGAANQDIEHVVHLVHNRERLDAIVNLLLSDPGAQTLIFCHTRADVADLGAALVDIGFTVATLSGEMEQAERNRALAAFKRGKLDAMVATDVAARGIDVADISRVIHADPPNDADAYTHRSGRTGRAGRKGTSDVLVTPPALVRTLRTLERARVKWSMTPIPSADEILAAQDEKLVNDLTGAGGESGEAEEPSKRLVSLAERLLATGDPARVIARLLARVRGRGPEPRHVTPIAPPAGRREASFGREGGFAGRDGAFAGREGREGPREGREGPREGGRRAMTSGDPSYRPFRISWGTMQGADARRLLAVVCRRGNIRGGDVGAIRLAPTFSVVEVKGDVAESFERSAREPDPRAPRVQIRPWVEEGGEPPTRAPRPERAPRAEAPSREREPAEAAPPERPSKARGMADTYAAPAERPSRRTVAETPAERPSKARVAETPAERPAKRTVAETPAERPSKARVAETPAERPARGPAAERPSRARAEETERPARARRAEAPEAGAPSRPARGAAPEERPRDRRPMGGRDDRGPSRDRRPMGGRDDRGPSRDRRPPMGGRDDRGAGPSRHPSARGPNRFPNAPPRDDRGPRPTPSRYGTQPTDRADRADRPAPRIIRGPVRKSEDAPAAERRPKRR